MKADLDDFSLLVDLKDPSDLQRRPAYLPCLDTKDAQLAEVLAPYYFNEQYPCGLASCRQPHQYGFLVITKDGIETNVGQVCGKNIFGDEFDIKANLQKKRAERKYQLARVQDVLDKKDHFLMRIAELYDRKVGTRWAESSLRQLKEIVDRKTALKLHNMATRGETAIEDVREATSEERERHKAMNPGAKPLNYVSEKVGDLHGLDFLNSNPHKALTELKDKLHELNGINIKELSSQKINKWVAWANDIERSFDEIEEGLAQAVRFFSEDNRRLVDKMNAIETRER